MNRIIPSSIICHSSRPREFSFVCLCRRVLVNFESVAYGDISEQLLRHNLTDDKYDDALAQLDFLPAGSLSAIRQIRNECRLDEDNINIRFLDQCLIEQINNTEFNLDRVAKKVVSEALIDRLTQYLMAGNIANSQLRSHIFQRLIDVAAYTQSSACNDDFGMLAGAAMVEAIFTPQSVGRAFDRFINELSPMFKFANCNDVVFLNINFDELLTNQSLQKSISDGLHELFSEQNIQNKTIGELSGGLIRLIKTVEGNLFVQPLIQSISFSESYDTTKVKNYLIDTLSLLFEGVGLERLWASSSVVALSFYDEPTLSDIVEELLVAVDFDKTLASSGNNLNEAEDDLGVVDEAKLKDLLKRIHHSLGEHFLDAYPSKITGLLVYGFDPQTFSEYVQETDRQKNALHKLFMYRVVRDTWSEQQAIESILAQLAALYPEETNTDRFLHYEILSNMRQGNNAIASSLANQVANNTTL
ncbi:MAG: hypothetical protein ACI9JR_000159 [Gammaproteobacteria bacterium]|jgi:hypothetical protein